MRYDGQADGVEPGIQRRMRGGMRPQLPHGVERGQGVSQNVAIRKIIMRAEAEITWFHYSIST